MVRSMARAEEVVFAAQGDLPKATLTEAFREVLAWLQTTEEVPQHSLCREIAREIIGQLSSVVALQGFRGSPQTYIA